MKISSIGVSKEFHNFGKYIQVAAILTIVSITTGMAGFIALIFVFIAMASLKKANYVLNNLFLHEFRSKYIRGVISRICGTVVLLIGGVNIGLFFLTSSSYPIYLSLFIPIGLVLSGIVFIYIGVAAEMKAWKNLKSFFENNFKIFPANISEEAIKGCDKLKKGVLLSSLGFLIVPAIIGFIYQVKGYFMLATLNKLSIDGALELELQPDLDKPKSVSTLVRKVNFCPNCGAKLSGLGSFCALCGSKIS
ncbi:MAG: zinc ribbon domain-containing protein [Promethearchaeota archaeon]